MNVINIRLFISFLFFAAGLVGFYILLDEPVVFRILSLLAGVVASLFVFWTTPLGQKAIGFLKEAVTEAKKVVWPTRKETIQMTLVVFVLVVLMAIFLAFVDIGFSYIINILLGRGS
jgi:preprotein translocase subunit SecE|tara:strand:- start:1402 stop:1752 length:351 start_codon:yes stop_codon:yes gene_type:complete